MTSTLRIYITEILIPCKILKMKEKSISKVLSVTTGSYYKCNKTVKHISIKWYIIPESLVAQALHVSVTYWRIFVWLGTGNGPKMFWKNEKKKERYIIIIYHQWKFQQKLTGHLLKFWRRKKEGQ